MQPKLPFRTDQDSLFPPFSFRNRIIHPLIHISSFKSVPSNIGLSGSNPFYEIKVTKQLVKRCFWKLFSQLVLKTMADRATISIIDLEE